MDENLFDPRPVLAGLKDFQRKTVDHVFRRLYKDRDRVDRFLVADEVGLGKTLVARGVVATAIAHLQQEFGRQRIDVIYVCSNADIARQNIARLRIGQGSEYNLPDRITLLPRHLQSIQSQGLNFISLTPGTSFEPGNRPGKANERVLLFWLLRHAWGWRRHPRRGVYRLLQGTTWREETFRNQVEGNPYQLGRDGDATGESLGEAFARALSEQPEIRKRFDELAARCETVRSYPTWSERASMIGDLRYLLARSCVDALKPDLIILDEFQRFRHLLAGEGQPRELAKALFDQRDAKVLLLSATPYKMYTLPDEAEDGQLREDHYTDFLLTTRFLMERKPNQVRRFEDTLAAFGQALNNVEAVDLGELERLKCDVQRGLSRVMCRTERPAGGQGGREMVSGGGVTVTPLELGDLGTYVATSQVSRFLQAGDVVEYWKSAPYLLNTMEGYKLKTELKKALADPERSVVLLSLLNAAALDGFAGVREYRPVKPANARLRWLSGDSLDAGQWRLLWLPPSLSYYRLGYPFDDDRFARFTKRLVFSAWNVVPQSIAPLLSYRADGLILRSVRRQWKYDADGRRQTSALLRFSRRKPTRSERGNQGSRAAEVGSLSAFCLIYPSSFLARIGDPWRIAESLNANGSAPDAEHICAEVMARIQKALDRVLPPEGRTEGLLPDERWYWIAPLLLDTGERDGNTWLREVGSSAWRPVGDGKPAPTDGAFEEAVAFARRVGLGGLEGLAELGLGPRPEDLAQVLARLAVAGPAVCALRAFSRVSGGDARLVDGQLRDGAARVAWGFRSLFNTPETTAMLQGHLSHADVYWKQVLKYCLDGCLQAVLDEYFHVLREHLGLLRGETEILSGSNELATPSGIQKMADEAYAALTIKSVPHRFDTPPIDGSDHLPFLSIRARYAHRYSSKRQADDSAAPQRTQTVRAAFNSPFWPFVLVTTSVGQEGLDFHLYCHAVVHWNLPANPVDLEQREGRVYRYKGHAVRKNVAQMHGATAFTTGGHDPWQAMFEAAREGRSEGANDLVPYWMTEAGDARIERYVPALPLSRDVIQLNRLKRSLALYRLVLGQSNQSDLLARFESLPEERREQLTKDLRIDLSPR